MSLSNSVTASVTGTAIGSALAAISANQWTTVTYNNTVTTNANNGTLAGYFDYGQKAIFDAPRNRVVYYGGMDSSASAPCNAIFVYDLVANTWATYGVNDGTFSPGSKWHGHFTMDVNRDNGDIWITGPDTNSSFWILRAANQTGTWQTWDNTVSKAGNGMTGGSGGADGLSWHPYLHAFIFFNNKGIWRVNPSTGAFTAYTTGSLMDYYHQFGGWNLQDNSLYIGSTNSGNGNAFGNPAIWRLGPGGVLSNPTSPTIPGVSPTLYGGQNGTFSAMVGSGIAPNKLLAIGTSGVIQEYDAVANSWSTVTTSVPGQVTTDLAHTPQNWAICNMPEYGCLFFFSVQAGTTNLPLRTSGYLWKR